MHVVVLLLPPLFCSVVSVVHPGLPLQVLVLPPWLLVVVVWNPFFWPLLLFARAPVGATSADTDAANTNAYAVRAIVILPIRNYKSGTRKQNCFLLLERKHSLLFLFFKILFFIWSDFSFLLEVRYSRNGKFQLFDHIEKLILEKFNILLFGGTFCRERFPVVDPVIPGTGSSSPQFVPSPSKPAVIRSTPAFGLLTNARDGLVLFTIERNRRDDIDPNKVGPSAMRREESRPTCCKTEFS